LGFAKKKKQMSHISSSVTQKSPTRLSSISQERKYGEGILGLREEREAEVY